MKRLVTTLLVLAFLIGVGVYYYASVDNNYQTLQEYYEFPVPSDATLESEGENSKNYIWEPSTGTEIPIKYRIVIRKNGWKEVELDGHHVTYEKDGKQINLVIAPDYIGILKVSNK